VNTNKINGIILFNGVKIEINISIMKTPKEKYIRNSGFPELWKSKNLDNNWKVSEIVAKIATIRYNTNFFTLILL
jgi:hypothetical protein